MLVGYARVSTLDQNPALQMDALREAGCEKIFVEKASSSHRDRPQLKAALNYLRNGDTLTVWKLSRLARSLTQVIKTAADISERGIALKVLTQNLISGSRRGLTPSLKALTRRRSAIEPEIGHMKTDGRLARCPLKGT